MNMLRILGLVFTLSLFAGCAELRYVLNIDSDDMENNRDRVVEIGKEGFPTLVNDRNQAHLTKAFYYQPDGGFKDLPNKDLSAKISKRLMFNYMKQFIGPNGRRISLTEKDSNFRGDYINLTQVNSIEFNDKGYMEISVSGMAKFKTMFARPSLRINEIKLQARPGIISVSLQSEDGKYTDYILAITAKFGISYLDIDNNSDSFDKGIARLLTLEINKNMDNPVMHSLKDYQNRLLFSKEYEKKRIAMDNTIAKEFGQVIAVIDKTQKSSDDILLAGINAGYIKIENKQLIVVGSKR